MNAAMQHDEIDSILSNEPEVVPSSGFALSVMDAVRREAAAPPPIAFPWKRALPGLIAAGLALGGVVVAGIAQVWGAFPLPASASFSSPMYPAMPPLLRSSLGYAAIWTAVALLATFVTVQLAMRFAGDEM
jgi:hypothetical protein